MTAPLSMAPRLIKRPAPIATPAPVATPATAPIDVWLGELHPRSWQRPGQSPVFAVGRLRRPKSRGILIHVVQIDATTLEVRHRLSEPDGPFVIVGTLRNGAGRLNLNADDESNPLHVRAVIEPRRRHEGWNLLRKELPCR